MSRLFWSVLRTSTLVAFVVPSALLATACGGGASQAAAPAAPAVVEIGAENATTVVFPLPMEFLNAFQRIAER